MTEYEIPEPPEPPQAQVVPLRAVDAQTEVRLDEAKTPQPAYVDLTGTAGQRRPVIPEHWRTREAARRHVALAAARYGHTAAYHGVRSPAYLVRSSWYAVRGMFVTSGKVLGWWHVPGTADLERQAAADGLLNDHLRLHRAGKETRKGRGLIILACAGLAIAALDAMALRSPWWGWALLAVILFTAAALAGRPAGRTITTRAQIPALVQPPTQDVIMRALGSIGIAQISRAIADGSMPPLPTPVREDGPGWRAEIDLPYGVTATQVIEKREAFASGLRRPLGAVWPEPVTHEHAGRLELWVGREDVSKAKPPPWPWLRSGGGDVFGPLPFGTSPRGKRVGGALVEHNWLIGSMPGQGKTSSVRVLVSGAALDPSCELWIHELKGTGDLDSFEQVSHRFVSGIDDESIGYAAQSLRLLRQEVMERSARLKKLDRVLCPDKKITRQISGRRGLRLWPVICVIDEAQNLFAHEKHGKQAADDATFVIKIGRALGVVLVMATQRPDKESLPTGISGNVSTRFCLKVPGQIENDMVLGTSAYKNGARATMFRPKVDAGLGYLKGEESVPQVVRTYYLNVQDAERIAKRARALRDTAGTLSGAALGEGDDVPSRSFLEDVLGIFGGEPKLWNETIALRLAERIPEAYADITPAAVASQLRALRVTVKNVREPGRNPNLGCERSAVEDAIEDGRR